MHLVGFSIRIYHDMSSSECQFRPRCATYQFLVRHWSSALTTENAEFAICSSTMWGSVSITFTSIVSRSGDNAQQKRAQALQKTQAQYGGRMRPYDKDQKNSVCPGMALDWSGVICLFGGLALYGNPAKS